MSLTRGQTRQRVQTNLNDAIGTFFDVKNVNDCIQEGYDELVLETQCIEKAHSVPFVPGSIYYDLYTSNIPNFWRISRIFNAQTNRWMPCVDSRVLDKFRFDWEAASGTPWFGYIVNFQYLGFFPHYSTLGGAAGQFDCLCKLSAEKLVSDNQIPQIPDPFNRALESYATANLLEVYQEFTKAADYWDDYNALKQKLREYVPSRSLPDKVWQLNDLDTVTFNNP